MVCLGSFLSAFVSTSHQIEDSENLVPDLPKLCALRVCHQAPMGFISPNPGDILHLFFFSFGCSFKDVMWLLHHQGYPERFGVFVSMCGNFFGFDAKVKAFHVSGWWCFFLFSTRSEILEE